jgi:hypothetical protein
VKPVSLRTARLVLDQPTTHDVGLTTGYCQDPLFEKYTIRHEGEFLGVIGYRPITHDIGFWLGGPHRGFG